ncbi:MAG TPA: hypothetical protein VFR67_14570, partial [Pilimelia sp.]|nr:hypothetical protein [Pilimelia sp.]
MSEREPAPHEPTLPPSGPALYPPPGGSPGPVTDAGAPYAGAPYALPSAGAMPGAGAPYPAPGGPPYAPPGVGPDGPVIAQIGDL